MPITHIKAQGFDEENICALITTRQGGVSKPPFDSMNIGLFSGDNPRAVFSNRSKLITTLNLPQEPSYLKQVHGIEVLYNPESTTLKNADAAITDKIGTIIAIQTADCLPILLADKDTTEVAGIHAGWRSLCDGIIENTLEHMHTPSQRLTAWLGPCICLNCFEVGSEVVDAFKSNHRYMSHAHKNFNGKDHLSLKMIARFILKKLGVSDIHESSYCTYCEKELFYSYRRDQTTGRMVSLIWINAKR